MIAQGYEGAAVMSVVNGCVHKIILDKYNKEIPYIHRYNHLLHFVIINVISADKNISEIFLCCTKTMCFSGGLLFQKNMKVLI